jgi:hypothetical protein
VVALPGPAARLVNTPKRTRPAVRVRSWLEQSLTSAIAVTATAGGLRSLANAAAGPRTLDLSLLWLLNALAWKRLLRIRYLLARPFPQHVLVRI